MMEEVLWLTLVVEIVHVGHPSLLMKVFLVSYFLRSGMVDMEVPWSWCLRKLH